MDESGEQAPVRRARPEPAIDAKPSIWYRINLVLVLANVLGAGFAMAQGEFMHAGTHGSLALAFWLWAQQLRQGSRADHLQSRLEGVDATMHRLDELESEMNQLRNELAEAQERLDFAERVLAKQPERRLGPDPNP